MIIHLFDFVKWGAPLGKPPSGKKADSRLAEEGLSFSDFLGTDQRPRRGRSAGPDFSPMRNRGKNRQRRGLPPPCGIHPAVLGVPASFSFQPLARWGHIDGLSFYGLYLLLCSACFYRQGLSLVCRCSQRWAAWLLAAGTPLLQGRPGCRNHSAIGPAAQGSLVWWHKQEPQQG